MSGLAALVDHSADDGVEHTDHGVDVGDENPLEHHRRGHPAAAGHVRPYHPELEQRLHGGRGEAGRQRRGDGGGGVAGPEQHQDRLERCASAAPALRRRDNRGQVARRGGVGQRHRVDDHAGRRDRQHRPSAALGAGTGGGGRAEITQQVQRLRSVEGGEQDKLRPCHRRVRRPHRLPQDDAGTGRCRRAPPPPRQQRRRGAEMHGAGLGEEQEREGERQRGEERAGALGEAVAEEEEELGRRWEPRSDEDAAEAAREGVAGGEQRRVGPREERGSGEGQREERRSGGQWVVVPEEGVQRRAYDLAGAAHGHHRCLLCSAIAPASSLCAHMSI
jgi:hypothetical protein